MSTNAKVNRQARSRSLGRGLCWSLLLAAAMLPGLLSGRTFTGPNGVTAEAEPVAVTDTLVTLRTLDGKMIQLPLASMNAADLAYVNDWRANHHKYAFNIMVTTQEADPPPGQAKKPGSNSGGGAVELAAHYLCYRVTIWNVSAEQTPATKFAYTLFTREATTIGNQNGAGLQKVGTGTADLPALEPHGRYAFLTSAVMTGSFKPPPGYHFTNGHGQYHRIDLAALQGTITLDDKPIWQYDSRVKTAR